MTHTIPRVGIGVIIEREGKVLLGLRSCTHGKGTWGLPGGHLELGEAPEDCAIREIMEETGLTIENPARFTFTNDLFKESGKHYVTLFMKVQLPAGEEVQNMEPNKCEKWEWFAPDDLPAPLMLSLANLLRDGYKLTIPTQKAA